MTNYQHLPLNELSRTLEEFSGSIKDPVLKLKFTQRVLDRYSKTSRVKKLPGLEAVTCRQIALEELNDLATSNQIDLTSARSYLRLRDRPSKNIPALGLIAAWLLVLALASYTMHSLVRGACRSYMSSVGQPPETLPGAVSAYQEPVEATKARGPLAAQSTGARTIMAHSPEEIWLVEKRQGYEFYSNGLRIFTEYETETLPRAYYIFSREGPLPSKVETQPVGLLYHTSEGDVLPFSSQYNGLMIETTRELLAYVKRHTLYNYIIDRFGRVYRVVKDHHAAYHAGFSIWSNNEAIYIGLNQSFIGMCFEGRWTKQENAARGAERGADASTISGAQIYAARMLTDLLRQKYHIPDRNCVTHGLASVNPKKFLVGYHLDWIRNFPFKELGLEDKYALPLPSITEFGFDYDDFFLEAVGGPLSGVKLAQEKLKERAAQNNMSYQSLRTRLRRDFERKLTWLRDGQARESAAAGNPSIHQESLN